MKAVATQDLDVVVVFAVPPAPLDPLRPILDRLPDTSYPRRGEHVEIAGVPVQFLPAWSPLVARAVTLGAIMSTDIRQRFAAKAA